jgi:hypothetical protein
MKLHTQWLVVFLLQPENKIIKMESLFLFIGRNKINMKVEK